VDRELALISSLAQRTDTRIVLLVMDGLGDVAYESLGNRTPLEVARTPNIDRLAAGAELGLMDPVMPGVTPGSGPGHTALFGYDPVEHLIGRGVLEGLGIGFEFTDRDVAARFNFASTDADGNITDRRAGRIDSQSAALLCERLGRRIPEVEGVETIVRPVKEHRGVVVFRGDDLGADVPDTDPQRTGVPPLAPEGCDASSGITARAAAGFVERATELLADEPQAHTLLLRGFSRYDPLPAYRDVFKLEAAALALYPMYRGLASLAGMDVLDAGKDVREQIDRLRSAWDDYEFFFVHVKKTDSSGEDGDVQTKIRVIEETDSTLVSAITELGPDVLCITGDHSTPCTMRSHSFHPVPVLVHAPTSRPHGAGGFGESACRSGSLGRFVGRHLLPMLMGHAGKLAKYGA
jgi:2,3-bisphosphoglycerate-independent phosphoglycerate mutase